MKIIISESQLKTIGDQNLPVSDLKNISWDGLVNTGRNSLHNVIENTINTSSKMHNQINDLVINITKDMKNSFEQDVLNGNLSKTTMNQFNKNIVSSLNEFNLELEHIPVTQRKLAKTVGRGKIKEAISKCFTFTGQRFFKKGFAENLKKFTNSNSPIIQNYIKVSNQMGDFVIGNQQLQNYVFSFIMGKL